MKKALLFGACLSLLVAAPTFGGSGSRSGTKVPPVDPPEADGKPLSGEETRVISPATYVLGPGDSIGFTVSDYATNGSACHNLINYGDGTFALGRMCAEISDATDRGTYYSHSEDGGVTWTPLSWVEGERRGWGNISQFADANGTEWTVSHNTLADPNGILDICVDADKGVNIWSCGPSTGATKLWARSAVSSPFYVHLVHANPNPATNILYSRSPDAGATFDILDQTLFTSPGFQAQADAYDIASFGTNVAIVLAPSNNVTSGDVLLATSTDNGTTWSEQVVYDVAGPGELTNGLKQFQPDGSAACVYDNAGNLHIVWTNFLAIGDVSNNPVLNYQIDAPLMYWSAATGIVSITPTVHDTTIAKPGNGFGNLVTQPDIGVDVNNNLYIVFQQQISEQDTALLYYQHIYATGSPDGGSTWTEPKDITPGTGFDASFASLADLVDDNIHLTYFGDPLAGNAIRGNHPIIPVAVMYYQYPAIDLTTGVREVPGLLPDVYRLDQNYPNPFNPTTKIQYSIPASSFVTLKIFDVLGREIATLVNGEQIAGSYSADFNATNLADGPYFYRIQAGNFSETKKMMLLK